MGAAVVAASLIHAPAARANDDADYAARCGGHLRAPAAGERGARRRAPVVPLEAALRRLRGRIMNRTPSSSSRAGTSRRPPRPSRRFRPAASGGFTGVSSRGLMSAEQEAAAREGQGRQRHHLRQLRRAVGRHRLAARRDCYVIALTPKRRDKVPVCRESVDRHAGLRDRAARRRAGQKPVVLGRSRAVRARVPSASIGSGFRSRTKRTARFASPANTSFESTMPTIRSLPGTDARGATIVELTRRQALAPFTTAVSLHAHTRHSRG